MYLLRRFGISACDYIGNPRLSGPFRDNLLVYNLEFDGRNPILAADGQFIQSSSSHQVGFR